MQNTIKVLIVEDDDVDVKVAQRAFKKNPLESEVYVVRDGQECLDWVRERDPLPDLILLDINMPKMDGIETLEKLKSCDRSKSIPVIMLTSSKNEKDVMRSYESGCASYIPKSVDYQEFCKAIDIFNNYWQTINVLPTRAE